MARVNLIPVFFFALFASMCAAETPSATEQDSLAQASDGTYVEENQDGTLDTSDDGEATIPHEGSLDDEDDGEEESALLEEDSQEEDEGEEDEESNEDDEGGEDEESDEEGNEQLDEQAIAEDFKTSDKNGDGLLEADEVSSLLQQVGAPSDLAWNEYDEDKDGKLSLPELTKLAQSHDDEDENASLLQEGAEEEEGEENEDGEESEEGDEEDQGVDDESEEDDQSSEDEDAELDMAAVEKDFNEYDKDKDGALGQSEVTSLLQHVGAPDNVGWDHVLQYDKASKGGNENGKIEMKELDNFAKASFEEDQEGTDSEDDAGIESA